VCFLLDAAKGATPVLLSGIVMGTLGARAESTGLLATSAWLAVGFAAILGHVFSIFLRLRGGKGVATAFGALISMWPLMTIPTIVGGAVFFSTRKVSGYMSLASIIGAWSIPVAVIVVALIDGETGYKSILPPLVAGTAIGCLVTVRHCSNIARIVAGTEPKAGVRDTMKRSQDAGGTEPSTTSTTHSDHR
jgi:glycerol-3-phosphate acyltransferase PlsY